MKLNCLAEKLGAVLEGSGDVEITGVAGLKRRSRADHFCDRKSIHAAGTNPGLRCHRPLNAPKLRLPLLRVKNPRLAFARSIELFTTKALSACRHSRKSRDRTKTSSSAPILPFTLMS